MNILAAVDFSEVTPLVLQQAAAMARAFGAKLYLLHVAEPEPEFVGYGVGPQVVRDCAAQDYHKEHAQVQDEARALQASGLDVTPLLVQGPSVQMILQEADKLHADLIVIGSHGHGAVYHLLTGSVGEGVLRKAKCPVLVVPARKPE